MIYKTHNYISKIYNYSIALTRRKSGSVAMGFAFAILNTMFSFVMIMMMMLFIRGTFGVAIRGEFGLYVLSGVSLFQLHNQILTEMMSANSDRQLMPLLAISPGIMLAGGFLHTLYLKTIIILIFLGIVWVYYGGFTFESPVKVVWIYLLCAAWSIAASMCAYSIIPVYKPLFQKVVMAYKRVGVITSGKMIPGNMLTGSFHGLFAWNPLFHCIDQTRGAIFINYHPFNSTLSYPIKATIFASALAVFLYVGLKRFR